MSDAIMMWEIARQWLFSKVTSDPFQSHWDSGGEFVDIGPVMKTAMLAKFCKIHSRNHKNWAMMSTSSIERLKRLFAFSGAHADNKFRAEI